MRARYWRRRRVCERFAGKERKQRGKSRHLLISDDTSQLQSCPQPRHQQQRRRGGGGSSGTAPTPSPPRQSYAKELLAQCRECRAELERERAKVEAKERKLAEREAGANSSGSEWWKPARYYHGFGGSEDKEPPSGLKATLVDLISLGTGSEESKEEESPSSLLSSVTSLFSSASPPSSTTDLHSDHEGEAGWIGSGVWGLSAVGQKQRQADREEMKRQAKRRKSTKKELEGEGEEERGLRHDPWRCGIKFLLAGGIAGAVSRTATAPFDRLKIYLITSAQMPATQQVSASMAKTPVEASTKLASRGAGMLGQAIFALYKEGGGLKAFWIGNGLNCLKIFPESAIKFLSYEMSKRAFAKYVDGVSDSRDISGSSRFMSGGIGGITSQLAIYPIETLKTRLMSSQGGQKQGNQLLVATARDMWRNGGMRTYYRGLTAGLVGVFRTLPSTCRPLRASSSFGSSTPVERSPAYWLCSLSEASAGAWAPLLCIL
ncbi:hypothetical protein L7F22_050414 [Adiantum nelumboides]|nr:hypothetical protein [Adiantum nelumboides]